MLSTIATAARRVAPVALIAAGIALAGPARAGSCPSDQVRPDGGGQKMNPAPGKDVTDQVLASLDLADEPNAPKDRLLRLRRLEIKPGGIVAWHSHANRPAIIYMIKGEIVEYSSTCAVPIVHRAGDVAVESHLTAHWWKNLGKTTVVLLSADLFPKSMTDHHMM